VVSYGYGNANYVFVESVKYRCYRIIPTPECRLHSGASSEPTPCSFTYHGIVPFLTRYRPTCIAINQSATVPVVRSVDPGSIPTSTRVRITNPDTDSHKQYVVCTRYPPPTALVNYRTTLSPPKICVPQCQTKLSKSSPPSVTIHFS